MQTTEFYYLEAYRYRFFFLFRVRSFFLFSLNFFFRSYFLFCVQVFGNRVRFGTIQAVFSDFFFLCWIIIVSTVCWLWVNVMLIWVRIENNKNMCIKFLSLLLMPFPYFANKKSQQENEVMRNLCTIIIIHKNNSYSLLQHEAKK